jgi:peptidoglycan/xylan/chitin deacetylase (PgdA/CDA1 family)
MSEPPYLLRPPIPILSYHHTDAVPPRGALHRGLVVPPQQFERQLRTLRRLGWRGLAMRDLEPYLRGELHGKVFGITLDDGYVNNFEHALPALLDVGFTATCFMVSAGIGGSNTWDQAIGYPAAPLMDLAQLKGWVHAGMEIGAHTRHHVDLLTCDAARARDEIAGSRHELERALDGEVRNFCFPYGRYREEHLDMVREAGFATATSCDSARAQAGADLLCLPRITVWQSTPLPMLVAKVVTGWEDWRRQAARSASPTLRRWMRGDFRGQARRPAAPSAVRGTSEPLA